MTSSRHSTLRARSAEVSADSPGGSVLAATRRVGRSAAVAALIGVVVASAWTGVAAAVPVTAVGGAAIVAALVDIRTSRIPNVVVLYALAVEACSLPLVAFVDDREMLPVLVDLAAGLALSGAPALFVVWLVAPRLVGGGDWKLLSVCGIAVGYLAPLGATVIVMGGFAVGIGTAVVSRRRDMILGPPLAFGYMVAIAAVVAWPNVFANWYR